MNQNKFGELVYDESDLCDIIMQGHDITELKGVVVDPRLNLDQMRQLIENPDNLLTWTFPEDEEKTISDFDTERQRHWYMPDSYKNLDIAECILNLCQTDAQLQRVGEELLLFQEHNLFDLLRYLKYLVDVMRENQIIWGVGRGSSVASYVLYLLGVHRIDSLYYDLDPREFLR